MARVPHSPLDFAMLTAEWPDVALRLLHRLETPWQIQVFLDETPYSTEPIYRSPLSVLRDRRAHCFDGALFAAAALRRLGLPPLILDMRAHNDDDHVVALFQIDGHWGAIAKSNTTVLRYREAVYRSRRELVMSYFDFYYNLHGIKALREYSGAVDLRRFDALGWMSEDAGLGRIAAHLDAVKHQPILTQAMIDRLAPVDKKLYDAGLLGADSAGLYQPEP